MNLFFDEDAQKLIVDAKKEMYELKHPYVGTEHLFLAILKNKDLDITKTLNSYNITYQNFYDELVKSIGIGTKSNDWFLFTPMLRRIINNSAFFADHNKITPYSLLISIFQEGDGVANRILLCLKIDIDSLYDNFINSYDSKGTDKKLLLDDLAINMNKEVSLKTGESVFGRDQEIDNIIQILLRKNKSNPLLIGEAGVGKTAIVEEFTRRIVNGAVPLKLKEAIIYNLPMSVLVAGTKYRGEFEERFEKIIKEAIDNPNIILFIDEIHTIIGAGGAEGAIDASNIIKPFLARDNLKIIGATTTEEYYKSIEKDKAFNRRFHKIIIEEPTFKEVRKILNSLKPLYEEFHGVLIPEKVINTIIKASNELIFYGRQPDKAIDLLDEVSSFSKFNSSMESELNSLNNKVNKLTKKKNNEIKNHNFNKALKLKKAEEKLQAEINKMAFTDYKVTITEEDIYRVLYRKSKIPILSKDYLTYKDELVKLFKDQETNIEIILKELNNFNFITSKKPLSFLLEGESINKNKFINTIISKVFDSSNLIKLDMNEYRDENSLVKITGSKYYDYDNNILNKIKTHPFSIIIIDNIDKANYSVLNYFIKSINRGYFTDYKNNKYYISKTIVFFTTLKNNNLIGFNNKKNNSEYEGITRIIDLDRNNKLIKS